MATAIRVDRDENVIRVQRRSRSVVVKRVGPRGLQGATGPGGDVADATSTVKGKIKLAGDLAGTADAPTVPGLTAQQATLDSHGTRLDGLESIVDVPDSSFDLQEWLEDIFLPGIPPTLGTGPNQNYRVPSLTETANILAGLQLVTQEAGKRVADIDLTAATTLLEPYGFTIEIGYDSVTLRPFVLVYSEPTYPASSNFRAWGAYLFDMSVPLTIVLEAPHPQTDGNSEYIALKTWQKIPGALLVLSGVNRKAKDWFVSEIIVTGATGGNIDLSFNSTPFSIPFDSSTSQAQTVVDSAFTPKTIIATGDHPNDSLHLFLNVNPNLYSSGNPTNTITGSAASLTGPAPVLTIEHDADVAHNYNALFSKAALFFASKGYAQLQMHGFNDTSSGVPRVVQAILSQGSSNTSKLLDAIRDALEANNFDVLLKGNFDTQGLYFSGSPTGGTFRLTCAAVQTASITYSTNISTLITNVQSALEAISTIGVGNVAVTQSQNDNGSTPTLVITFKGQLYHLSPGAITVTANSLIGGSSPAPVIVTADDTGLTALSNTQGDIAESEGNVFMHLELSATVRTDETLSARLINALGAINLPQLSAAALPVLAEPGHTPSQAPSAVARAATTGTRNYAANAGHTHAWSNSDSTAGNDYFAMRNSTNTGNVWNSPAATAALLTAVMHLTGDETATGIKAFTTDSSGRGPQIYRGSSSTGQEATLGFRVSTTFNNLSNMAEIVAVRTDSPNSQDTAIVFRNRRGGSAASEVVRFDTSGIAIFLRGFESQNGGAITNAPLDMNTQKIINVATPTDGTDAVNKNYVTTASIALIRANAAMPTGAIAQSFDRRAASSTTGTNSLSTGRLSMYSVYLTAGTVVTSITFISSGTALSAGTNQWFALFDGGRNKLAITNDDTSTAWGSNTAKTLNLTSPYTILADGTYYVGINVTASTVPNLLGLIGSSVLAAIPPIIQGTADSGLTNPASCPPTATALTATTTRPYWYIS